MSTYKPKQIVFAKFPFTDNPEASKDRPCLIVAVCKGYVWALMVTKVDSRGNYDEYIYQLSENDLSVKLPFTSCVRANILMTIDVKAITKIVTTVKDEAYERIHDLYCKMHSTGIPANLF